MYRKKSNYASILHIDWVIMSTEMFLYLKIIVFIYSGMGILSYYMKFDNVFIYVWLRFEINFLRRRAKCCFACLGEVLYSSVCKVQKHQDLLLKYLFGGGTFLWKLPICSLWFLKGFLENGYLFGKQKGASGKIDQTSDLSVSVRSVVEKLGRVVILLIS